MNSEAVVVKPEPVIVKFLEQYAEHIVSATREFSSLAEGTSRIVTYDYGTNLDAARSMCELHAKIRKTMSMGRVNDDGTMDNVIEWSMQGKILLTQEDDQGNRRVIKEYDPDCQ